MRFCKHISIGPLALSSVLLIVASMRQPGWTDELIKKDGTRMSGFVISSTEDSIFFDGPFGKMRVAHADVDTFRFTASDVIEPKEGLAVRGKLLRKEQQTIFVATTEGIVAMSGHDIKATWYGRGSAIALTKFGKTGSAFSSHRLTSGEPIALTQERTYSLGGRAGIHFGLMHDWKSQFEDENGSHPSATFIQLGPEAYYDISQTVFVGGGGEYLWGRKVTVEGLGDDRTSAKMIFGTIGFLRPIAVFGPKYEVGGAMDIGYLWGKEHVSVGGSSADGKAQTIAIRPKFIYTYVVNRHYVMRSEIGWLIANAKKMKVGDQALSDYDLDFSGLSLTMGFAFVGPL